MTQLAITAIDNKNLFSNYYMDNQIKNNLKAGYDPKNPTNYKHLLEWYMASVSKLKSLIKRIEITDRLIDQIIYRLYGLTEEEVRVVEGGVGL